MELTTLGSTLWVEMLQDVLLVLQLISEALGVFWTDLLVLVDTSFQKQAVIWR